MPTRRSKEPNETHELIKRLEAIAVANSYEEITITSGEIRMLLDELDYRTALAKAAITARIQRPSGT